MITAHFTIPGNPVAKARARHRAIHTGAFYFNATKGRKEEKIIPQEYTPKESMVFENLVRTAFVAQFQGQPWSGPVSIDVVAFIGAPKSLRKWERELVDIECMPHTRKPDGDNVIKAIKDGLRSVAYVDDNLVFDGHYRKIYSNRPRTEVTLSLYTMEELCQNLKQEHDRSCEKSALPGNQTTQPLQLSLVS